MSVEFNKILVRPIFTEKMSRLEEENKYSFQVLIGTNKLEIKKAVEELFKVEVLKVTTSIVKGKRKRNRFGMYKRSDYKKAFVSISKDSEIQFEGIN